MKSNKSVKAMKLKLRGVVSLDASGNIQAVAKG